MPPCEKLTSISATRQEPRRMCSVRGSVHNARELLRRGRRRRRIAVASVRVERQRTTSAVGSSHYVLVANFGRNGMRITVGIGQPACYIRPDRRPRRIAEPTRLCIEIEGGRQRLRYPICPQNRLRGCHDAMLEQRIVGDQSIVPGASAVRTVVSCRDAVGNLIVAA